MARERTDARPHGVRRANDNDRRKNMDHIYSHSYYDPETGEYVDVVVPEGVRNARTRAVARPTPRRGRPVRSPRGPSRAETRTPVYRSPIQRSPVMVPQPGSGQLVIDKAAMTELIPVIGKVWASFLGRPNPPKATGDDVIDRDNAALHRDALAQHHQNQTRILALTDLAQRAIKMVIG
jgi:hypothetical protein